MSGLAQMLARVPRFAAFAMVALIQVALIAYLVVDRAGILRSGTEVMLQTRPVDPRDFLRGDYVILSYDISALPARGLMGKPSTGNPPIYVKLARKPDGFYEAVSLHKEPVSVAGGEVLILGRVFNGQYCGERESPVYCPNLGIKYGLEQYFVPEGEGREIESARNQGKVTVVAAVAPSGRAAIKRLLIDGKPAYDEPMF